MQKHSSMTEISISFTKFHREKFEKTEEYISYENGETTK